MWIGVYVLIACMAIDSLINPRFISIPQLHSHIRAAAEEAGGEAAPAPAAEG